jgi:non-heme chloroperoxidase
MTKKALKAIVACANAFATTDFRPDLKSIEVPALVFQGTEDKVVRIGIVLFQQGNEEW